MENSIPLAISYTIGASLIIGGIIGVPNPKQCDITNTYHVHLYTKDIDNVKIVKYLPCTKNDFSFTKQDTFLPATNFDLKVYNNLDYLNLFDGRDNIDFINYQIATRHDYMDFYYYYKETYTEEDSEGNIKEKTVTHSGWTINPYHRGITGKVRVNHPRYYAYKITINNNNLDLIQSDSVDDIRTIINEYPYISENTYHYVSKIFYFFPLEVPFLKLEDFNPFYSPTVENNPLENYSLTLNKN